MAFPAWSQSVLGERPSRGQLKQQRRAAGWSELRPHTTGNPGKGKEMPNKMGNNVNLAIKCRAAKQNHSLESNKSHFITRYSLKEACPTQAIKWLKLTNASACKQSLVNLFTHRRGRQAWNHTRPCVCPALHFRRASAAAPSCYKTTSDNYVSLSVVPRGLKRSRGLNLDLG